MATQTLLDMTQEILSALSGDEVNSIGDTTESLQVATCIKRKYFDIVARSNLPEHNQLIALSASTDGDMPVLMTVPAEVNKIEWIKYFDSKETDNVTPGYQYVTILPIQQFVDMVNVFNPDETNVGTFSFTDNTNSFPGAYTFYYKTDHQPCYCTFISNYYVIFDSFNSELENTLQNSKTMAYGQVAPAFMMEDTFIPRLDDKQFSLLLNEAKALAFFELKQMPHQKAEQEIKRQWTSMQKNKSVDHISDLSKLPNFGRPGLRNTSPYWYGKRY